MYLSVNCSFNELAQYKQNQTQDVGLVQGSYQHNLSYQKGTRSPHETCIL